MTADEVIAELDKLGSYDYVTPIWWKSCYPSSQHGRAGHQAQGTWCHTAVETKAPRWQNWLKDIDQVTLSPKPPSSKMEVNFETLDFIVSQLDSRQSNL